jgi:hypothetical protein
MAKRVSTKKGTISNKSGGKGTSDSIPKKSGDVKKTKKKRVAAAKKGTTGPQKKTTTRRRRASFPGLTKQFFSRIKQEYHDIDYVEQLTEKQKDFLSRFMDEWLGAKLNNEGKVFHKSKKMRRKCFNMNNSRNRDIYSIAKARGNIRYYPNLLELMENNNATDNYEGVLIDYIDKKSSSDSGND